MYANAAGIRAYGASYQKPGKPFSTVQIYKYETDVIARDKLKQINQDEVIRVTGQNKLIYSTTKGTGGGTTRVRWLHGPMVVEIFFGEPDMSIDLELISAYLAKYPSVYFQPAQDQIRKMGQ